MRKAQQDVRDFMQAFGQATPERPTAGDFETRLLRYKLVAEELEEYKAAAGIRQDRFGEWRQWENPDLIEMADAVGDLLYVVLGAAVAHGIDIEPIFAEIHRSNLSKKDGHRCPETGKWLKGPNYSPASLAPIIEAQGVIAGE